MGKLERPVEKSLKNVVCRTDSDGVVSQSLKGELILAFKAVTDQQVGRKYAVLCIRCR